MNLDCHIHMVLDGYDWRGAIARHKTAPDRDFIRKTLESYKKRGCTYLRDGGDRWGVCYAAREMAGEYGLIYKAPGAPLYYKGHYGSFIGTGFSDLKEYACLVEDKHREGADFLKIMISGLMDFNHYGRLTQPGLEPEMIKEMIHIGKEEGFSVMAHANGAETVMAAAEAGVDSIEHGAYLNGETLAALKEKGCVWVPTLSTVGNLIGKGRFPDREVQLLVEDFMERLWAFATMGGLIACGSDAGAWAVPHEGDTEMTWLTKTFGASTESIVQKGNAEITRRF